MKPSQDAIELQDAHCHYSESPRLVGSAVVNGTCPDDWPELLNLAAQNTQLIPAIGLHPWKVATAPTDWQRRFLQALPYARAVGEIGLDQWVKDHDIAQQQAAFRWQLEQATKRNLPVSIHCLKASGALLHILNSSPLPARGIHLHAYSGSAEQVKALAKLGAYFSFHAGQFKPNAKKVYAAAQAVPRDRLLIETDAPDTLQGGEGYNAFLKRGYTTLAKLRNASTAQLAESVTANFNHYFQA